MTGACTSVVSLVSCSLASTPSSIFDSEYNQDFPAEPSEYLGRDICHLYDDDCSSDGIGHATEGSMATQSTFGDASSISSGPCIDMQDNSDEGSSASTDDYIWRSEPPYIPSDEFQEEYPKLLALYSGEGGENLFEQPILDLSMSTDGSQWSVSESTPPYEHSEAAEQDTPACRPQQVVQSGHGSDDEVGSWTVYTDGLIDVGADERDEWDELSHWALNILADQHAEASSQQVIEIFDNADNTMSEPIDKIWATPEAFQAWVEGSLGLNGALLLRPYRRNQFV